MPENPDRPSQKVIVPARTIPMKRIAAIAGVIVALVAVLYFFAVGGIRSHHTDPASSAPNSSMTVPSAATSFAA